MDIQPKILVVDDKPENLYTMRAILWVLDAEVVCASSGEEALRLSLEHDFCLAIVDVQMPGMDGYELVSLFRSNMNTNMLPVIFVSAIYLEDCHFQKGYETGAVDFLSKPINADILLSKVKVFIQQWQQKQELQNLISQLNDWNKYLEDTVQQRTEMIEAENVSLSNRVKLQNELYATAARELRASLVVLHGSLSSLAGSNADQHTNESETDVARQLQLNEKQLAEVIISMADSMNLWDGLSALSCKPILLQEIIASVCNDYQPILQESNLTIVAENLNILPAILLDASLMEQAFRRIILHALLHTPEGGQVTIAGEQLPAGSLPRNNRKALGIHVTVQGPGLGSDYAQWITRVINQPESTPTDLSEQSGAQRGSALSFSITKKIVDAHEGLLSIEPLLATGRALPGMVFHILLPL